jgi:hypothetical protein
MLLDGLPLAVTRSISSWSHLITWKYFMIWCMYLWMCICIYVSLCISINTSNNCFLYIHKPFFYCRKFIMDWISLLTMMVMNLGFSLSNFQRMGESLCQELVIVRYVCMISEQISLALESLLTWYYIVFTYNWLLLFCHTNRT